MTQLETLVHRMHSMDEKLLVILTGCAKLTDAVEAEELGVLTDLERIVDPLNFKRCLLICGLETTLRSALDPCP